MAFNAPTCPKCGAPNQASEVAKSKSTAVLLAVFLSFWTWLYTYRADRWRFWTGLGIAVAGPFVSVIVLAFLGTSISNLFVGTAPAVAQPVAPTGTPAWVALLGLGAFAWPSLTVWLWAVLNRTRTPSSAYDTYQATRQR